MKNFINQPFHLVTLSPWPLMISINLWTLMMGMVMMFNFSTKNILFLSFFSLMLISFQWWQDITRESSFQGFHTMNVLMGMKISMLLFIISEIFFFISFFWSYFHMILSPNIELGGQWPPTGMSLLLINPYSIPLLNTILLVSSSIFLSMSHHAMILKNFYTMNKMMIMTILFGMIFMMIQLHEYNSLSYTINMSTFGSTFFMMTGFHGVHIIIGTIFLLISFIRMNLNHFSNIHHFGFEASAWYWHFVDIIWLFLFLLVYWWPY